MVATLKRPPPASRTNDVRKSDQRRPLAASEHDTESVHGVGQISASREEVLGEDPNRILTGISQNPNLNTLKIVT